MLPTIPDAPDTLAQAVTLPNDSVSNSSKAAPVNSLLKPPFVNVWVARKEQMAAARHQKRQQHLPPSESNTTSITSISLPSDDRSASRSMSHIDSSSTPNVSVSQNAPRPSSSMNGQLVEEEDPFVVRIHENPALPATDSDNWPQVGKSSTSAKHTASANIDSSHVQSDATKDDRELHQGHNHSRKNEKPKWIPIPAEELQAAADALAKETKQHHPHHHYASRGLNNHNAYVSGSTYGHGRSRPHSTSHSRMHSRAGSLQSSPRLSKGRRLPGDESNGTAAATNGLHVNPSAREKRVSGETSPLVVKPHLQPRHQSAISLSPTTQHSHRKLSADDTVAGELYPQSQPHTHGSLYPTPPYLSQSKGRAISPDGFPPYDPQRPTAYPHYIQHPSAATARSQVNRDSTSPLSAGYSSSHAEVYPAYMPHGYHVYGSVPFIQGHNHNQKTRTGYEFPAQISTAQSLPLPQQHIGYWSDSENQPGTGSYSPVYAPPSLQPQRHTEYRHNQRVEDERAGNEPVVVFRKHAPTATEIEDGEHKVVFGTIESAPGETSPLVNDRCVDGAVKTTKTKEKHFVTPVSIGVAPDELGLPRSRSRTHSGCTNGSGSGIGRTPTRINKVIDLTDSSKEGLNQESKWEFGTATTTEGVYDSRAGPEVVQGSLSPLGLDNPQISSSAFDESESHGTESKSVSRKLLHNCGAPSSPSELHKRLEQLSVVPNLAELDDPGRDVFEVKDFGYGFGGSSKSGDSASPPEGAVDSSQRLADGSDKGNEGESGGQACTTLNQTPEGDGDLSVEGRSHVGNERKESESLQSRTRRAGGGIQSGNSGYSHHHGGSGSPRRGRNGYGRGYRRGPSGYNQPPLPPRGGMPASLSLPPGGLFRPPLPSMGGDPSGFYYTFPPHINIPSRTSLMTYIPPGCEGYMGVESPVLTSLPNSMGSTVLPPRLAAAAGSTSLTAPAISPLASSPPVPVPVSPITFPLNPTRWYLLGQLEYYLSPQNLAQDFFLRQRMDSRGWVPIALIASFNRVRQFAVDLQVVKEVLMLSSVVEVRDEWVRMVGWERFVLPDAPASTVEEGPAQACQDSRSEQSPVLGNNLGERCIQEEQKDDVLHRSGNTDATGEELIGKAKEDEETCCS